MSRVEVDFLPSKDRKRRKNKKKNHLYKIITILVIIIVIIMAVFSSSVVFSDDSLLKNLSKFNFLQQVGRLITARDKNLDGESDDRINFLIIGMGGINHQGGTLADTIILSSFKPSTNQVAIMSIPRDLSVPIGNGNWMKINAIHAYAEKDEPKSGGPIMVETLNQLLDTEIHYHLIVDFEGFEKIIDEFGGVDIEVENNLIDYEYPIRGKEFVYPIENRYETLNIKKGLQHMDGELALKYARSRHGIGIEGSDFARSRRQQKIMAALKEKVFTINTFFSPKRINGLLKAYNEHIITNMEIWEMLRLAQLGREVDASQIISQTLGDGPNGLLHPQIINEAYVLLPDDGNYETIKKIWHNIFYAEGDGQLKSVDSSVPQATTTLPDETDGDNQTKIEPEPDITDQPEGVLPYQNDGATIEIHNGTWINGLASQERDKLTENGMTVIAVANADNHEYSKNIIYDLSGGSYTATAQELKNIYNAEISATPITLNSSADFVVILGR